MALGPVSYVTPAFSAGAINPRLMRCLTASAGHPQRIRRSASGISTQYTPLAIFSFFIAPFLPYRGIIRQERSFTNQEWAESLTPQGGSTTIHGTAKTETGDTCPMKS